MRQSLPYLAKAVYYPHPGKEKEFLRIWREGPYLVSMRHGGEHIGIYWNRERDEYIATSHWPSEEKFQKYSDSAELSRWIEAINHISRSSSYRDLYTIIEEAA